ncbi:MAG: peroxiredoxin [Alphaproteobacteria bacterium]|nr:peroxiredoxin [Alphaproteobacteria bacterium]
MPAPTFDMMATNIGEVNLAKFKGHPFVLYFYPKDETSGCTAEACGFRDAMPKFDNIGVAVIGVSRDSIASHQKFKKKFDIDFPLASDEDGKACEDYGVWIEKSLYGRKYMGIDRATFLIDAKGIIRAVWRHVSVPGHVDQVRKAAAAL